MVVPVEFAKFTNSIYYQQPAEYMRGHCMYISFVTCCAFYDRYDFIKLTLIDPDNGMVVTRGKGPVAKGKDDQIYGDRR